MSQGEESFNLDPLIALRLLENLPAYRDASYRYPRLQTYLPELKGKTQGQLDRLQRNLQQLSRFRLVSQAFLEHKISVGKLCGATDKFQKTCQKLEQTL